jgi:hypothetical protein
MSSAFCTKSVSVSPIEEVSRREKGSSHLKILLLQGRQKEITVESEVDGVMTSMG